MNILDSGKVLPPDGVAFDGRRKTMYRAPAARASRGGMGVSGDGYDGAESFFEQTKTVAGELKLPGLPTDAAQSAAAKAAVDAYMSARNGLVSSNEAFFHQGNVPGEFPAVDLKADSVGHVGGDASPMSEIGKAVTDLMSHMGDMLNQLVTGPMGMLGSLLQFLAKVFTEMAEGIGTAVSEAAQAIATVVEDTWKKQLEMASTAANQAGLQPLELYNQAATTQVLSTALKTSAST